MYRVSKRRPWTQNRIINQAALRCLIPPRGPPPTCERVLRLPDPLHHHPGVVLSDARRALVVGAPVFQYVMVYLAVGLREGPNNGDGVVTHLAV